MELSLREGENCRYLSFFGCPDASSSSEAGQALRGILDECRALLAGLGRLSYIGCAKFRVLLSIARRIESNRGKLLLCCLRPVEKSIFELSGLTSIFNICDDLQSAGNAIR